MAEEETKKAVMTNKQFSLTNLTFIQACEEAKLPPTTRQASRWRMGKGKAYKTVNKGV